MCLEWKHMNTFITYTDRHTYVNMYKLRKGMHGVHIENTDRRGGPIDSILVQVQVWLNVV